MTKKNSTSTKVDVELYLPDGKHLREKKVGSRTREKKLEGI